MTGVLKDRYTAFRSLVSGVNFEAGRRIDEHENKVEL